MSSWADELKKLKQTQLQQKENEKLQTEIVNRNRQAVVETAPEIIKSCLQNIRNAYLGSGNIYEDRHRSGGSIYLLWDEKQELLRFDVRFPVAVEVRKDEGVFFSRIKTKVQVEHKYLEASYYFKTGKAIIIGFDDHGTTVYGDQHRSDKAIFLHGVKDWTKRGSRYIMYKSSADEFKQELQQALHEFLQYVEWLDYSDRDDQSKREEAIETIRNRPEVQEGLRLEREYHSAIREIMNRDYNDPR